MAEALGVEPVEKKPDEQSPAARAAERALAALRALARIGVLSAFLTPLLLIAILTLDIPFRAFDIFPPAERYLNPSSWLTWGQMLMALSFLVVNLASRRFGENYALAMVAASWTIAAAATLGFVTYLAPALEAGDLPSPRFTASFVAAWMLAHFVCLSVYEITRGVIWWRAPFYGAVWGGGAYAAVYFPLLYFGTGAPWPNWMLTDFTIKVAIAGALLLPYRWLRRIVRPLPGYGAGR